MRKSTLVLVVLAVVLTSVIGSVLSALLVRDFALRFSILTGGVTSSSAYINFTTVSNVAVSIVGEINFGGGYINGSSANLSSENFSQSANWVNSSAPWSTKMNLTIVNTGNTFVNVSLQANQSVTSWIGSAEADARLAFVDGETRSCTSAYPANYSVQPNTTLQSICVANVLGQGVNFSDASDEIAVFINLLIPNSTSGGLHATELNFIATGNQ